MSPSLPLLGLIARGDAYGYELKRTIDAEFAPYWRIDFAQLYRTLAKLHAAGLVRVKDVRGDGGPDRKLYRITPDGSAAVDEWLGQAAESQDEFWIKLRLAILLGHDTQALVRGERERMSTEWSRKEAHTQNAAPTQGYDTVDAAEMPLRFAGSDDPLLARLAEGSNALSQVVGSTAGLIALANEQADAAGVHLREPNSGEYNISFVEHLAPEQDVLLVRLAVREYGLVVARGNPKRIRGVRDLARREVRMLNRTRGAGSRLWLQRHLTEAHIDPETLRDWSHAANTYSSIAMGIQNESVDAGPGLRTTAEQFNLDFIVLGQEQFDLAIPRWVYEGRRGERFRKVLHSKEFRKFARALPGYDLSDSGRVITEIKFGRRRK